MPERQLEFGVTAGVKSSGLVPVTFGGQTVNCVAERDVTYLVGDPVIICKVGAQWFVLNRYYAQITAPPTSETPPDPKPTTTTGQLVISPMETRSYRTSFSVGWRTDDDDVYHGQYGGYGNHIGSVFYGTKPRTLDGATVTSASVKIRVDQIGSYPPSATVMRLMTNSTRPSGAPTLTSTTSGPSVPQGTTINAFTVPTAWAQAMVDGMAGGIAFYDADGSPYVRYAGRSKWSPSFTMTINWQRG